MQKKYRIFTHYRLNPVHLAEKEGCRFSPKTAPLAAQLPRASRLKTSHRLIFFTARPSQGSNPFGQKKKPHPFG